MLPEPGANRQQEFMIRRTRCSTARGIFLSEGIVTRFRKRRDSPSLDLLRGQVIASGGIPCCRAPLLRFVHILLLDFEP